MTLVEIITMIILVAISLLLVVKVYDAIRFFINDESVFTYEMHTDKDGNTYERVVDSNDKNTNK